MATRQTTPPILQGPTAKEKKYDRQLRLWAASGQQALEEASVLLLNSGSGVVGVETLKNLILPGVGNFTIVDEAKVTESDLGVNFFLEEESLGKSRAEECRKYLNELNPEVNGYVLESSIAQFVDKIDDWITNYNLILHIGPSKLYGVLDTLSDYASRRSIPLFHIHSIGFYSQFSVQLPAKFPIVDTHPDPVSTQDLRLLDPWPELLEFMRTKTKDLESLSDHEHGHVPYLLLLLQFLERWKNSHNGTPPANYQEKKAFKAMVEEGARKNNAEGGEENFDEAAAAVLKSLNPPSISNGIREVLESEDAKDMKKESPNFWLIAHAIHKFHSNHGVLPLPGALPDMKAQSADYIRLQNIYKAKARKDVAEIIDTIRSIEKDLGRTPVQEKEIEAFCKGAAFVKLIHGRPLRIAGEAEQKPNKEYFMRQWDEVAKFMCQELQNEESLLPISIAFSSHDWAASISSLPVGKGPDTEGKSQYTVMEDYYHELLARIKKSAQSDLDTEVTLGKLKNAVDELYRARGAELHNVSALTGGMVAQEVIKAITRQYVPIDNTCVFDGVTSRTAVFRL